MDVNLLSVLGLPKQLNTNHVRSSHFTSSLVGWGYVAVPGLRLQADLVGEVFYATPLSTFPIACFLIVIFLICLINRPPPPLTSHRYRIGK